MPLRLLLISAVLFLNGFYAQANEAIIFDIRRPVPMTNGEVLPQDFFLNVGSADGVKVDMVITVNRRQTIYDSYSNKSSEDLVVPVGQIRVIHVQQGLSVARIEKLFNRAMLPSLDYDGFMVGDRLDMGSARVQGSKTAAIDVEIIKFEKLESASLAPQIPATLPEQVNLPVNNNL